MPTERASVCAVTVTYGSRLELCAQAVGRALSSGVTHVIVVDNGSARGDEVLETFGSDGRISVVRMGGNVGSAGGFAAGIDAAVRRREDYVLLLDDDNILGVGSLATALKCHADLVGSLGDERVCVACLRTSNPFHRRVARGDPVHRVYPPAGSFISLDLLQRLSRRLVAARGREADRSGPPAIPVAPYGGLLLRREALERIGGPDPRLTLYEDDTAWTHGITRNGYRIFLCADAPIEDADPKWLDDGDAARGPVRMLRAGSTGRLYYSVRNRVLFDFGRAATPGARMRYRLNRALFVMYVRGAGRGAGLAAARRTFFTAVEHGEAGRLDLGPPLEQLSGS